MGKDGAWALDCPCHLQTNMDEAGKRHEEDLLQRGKMRWGKTPECQSEPSSSSGQPNQAQPGGSTDGMAVAAYPPTTPESATRQEKSDPPIILEDIPRQVSTTRIETEKRLGDMADLSRLKEGKQAGRPVAKPGTLLGAQFEDEFNQRKGTSPPGA